MDEKSDTAVSISYPTFTACVACTVIQTHSSLIQLSEPPKTDVQRYFAVH